MNLVEIHSRAMAGFAFHSVKAEARECFGEEWLGLELAPHAAPQISIQNISTHRPLRSFPVRPGWFALSDGAARLSLKLICRETGKIWAEKNYTQTQAPCPLEIPWPGLEQGTALEADLNIHAESGPVFLAVSRRLDRKEIIATCKGKGVEIGPGVTPQILPAPDIDVIYAEEKSREDWLKTYAYKLDKYKGDLNALPWERYHTRDAFNLPAEAGSLDFIFASHVLEHLVNPLGHLEHWLSKLKPGGIIAGILPHCDYSGDYQMLPSMLPTIALEYQRRETKPNLNHYRTMFGPAAEARMAEGRTLHVHFYNGRNLQDFFSWAGGQLPIGSFRIKAEPNYREFFFTVRKK